MLSGVKFIPRNKINQAEKDSESSLSMSKKKKHHKSLSKRKKHYSSSSDTEDDGKYRKKRSKRKPKWDTPSSSSSESDVCEEKRKQSKLKSKRSRKRRDEEATSTSSEEEKEPKSNREDVELARKEMGLEWMVRPSQRPAAQLPQEPPLEVLQAEKPISNPKELNPYFKNDGSGYPEDDECLTQKAGAGRLPPPSVVGDGGASWRLKALKRAKEQAAREGRKLDEVVEERWGSIAQMTASVATTRAAPAHSHLHAIRERKGEQKGDHRISKNGDNIAELDKDDKSIRNTSRDYLRDVSVRESRMKAPKIHNSLSWRNKRNDHSMRPEDAELIRTAACTLNKYESDGSFLKNFNNVQNKDHENSSTAADSGTDKASGKDSCINGERHSSDMSDMHDPSGNGANKSKATAVDSVANVHGLTANQLAAKAMQLRLKGKHAEADKLLKELESVAKGQDSSKENIIRPVDITTSDVKNLSEWSKRKVEDDADLKLASIITRNKQFRTDSQADDEHDFDDIPAKKEDRKSFKKQQAGKDITTKIQKRILTQQERCNLCFESLSRPKHLTISIANFTYLMLPPWEPVVTGHCYILPLQHEASTRNLDDNVFEELRNFKKCLLRMFAEEEKDVLFMETVMGLAQQRRHCLVECIPLPHDIAKEAPLYFKKAIDEAEEEWSQHNAKKLIDTSVKGLRGSVPKNFPYFHVEFGLNKGFVHVIDDEKNFRSQFGLNVIRGMLQLREEDMYRRRQYDSFEMQRKAASEFAKKWLPFDWTKMLD